MWCGLAKTREAARGYLAPAMEAFYRLKFEQFERYCPYGGVEDVVEFLRPYVEAGCREFNLITCSSDQDTAIAMTADVRRQPRRLTDRVHGAVRRDGLPGAAADPVD